MQAGVVMFDLDGTLFQAHLVSVRAAQQAMSDLGLAPATPEEIIAQFGEPMDRFCSHLAPEAAPDLLQQLARRISDLEQQLIPVSGRLFDGVFELLHELLAKGFALAVVSNGSPRYVNTVLRTSGVGDCFRFVKGREAGKSKADLVADVMASAAGSFGILVGDRIHDAEAARANRLPSIGVTYGYGGDEVHSTDFQAACPAEILGHVLRNALFHQMEGRLLEHSRKSAPIVGINGVDTAGKTTFARTFRTYLTARGHRAVLIHLDDFHNPRSIRTQGSTAIQAYIDHAFNLELLCSALLEPVRQGKPVDTCLTLLDIDRDTLSRTCHFAIDEKSVVIVEGVLLFREPLNPYFDFRLYLEIGFDEVLRRAAERDVPLYGPAFLERYRQKYIPIQQWYLMTHDPKAQSDMVIDNTDCQRPRLLAAGTIA